MSYRSSWSLTVIGKSWGIVRTTDGYQLGSGAPYRAAAEPGTPEWEAEVGDTIVALSPSGHRVTSGVLFAEKPAAEMAMVLFRDILRLKAPVPGWVWWAWSCGWRPVTDVWTKKIQEGAGGS